MTKSRRKAPAAPGRLDPATLALAGCQLVEASAGTGKTHAITHLVLRLVLEQELPVDRILVVTFTRAATDELRARIRHVLADAARRLASGHLDTADTALAAILQRAAGDARAAGRLAHLSAQASAMDDAAIFTIHSFCQRALAEHAFESGQRFDAELETDTSGFLRQSVTDHWRRRFAEDAFIARFAAVSTDFATPAALLAAVKNLVPREYRVDAPTVDSAALATAGQKLRKAWKRDRSAFPKAIDEAVTRKELSGAKDTGVPAHVLAAAIDAIDAFVADAGAPLPDDAAWRIAQSSLDAALLKKAITAGIDAPSCTSAKLLDALEEAAASLRAGLLAEALAATRADFTASLTRAGRLGYDDLVRTLRDALRGPQQEALAARIAARHPAVLIDEFQDTDPAQFEVFRRVYEGREGTCLLLIGDPKQAIYSFRGADVFAYLGAAQAAGDDARHTLGTNWRSVKPLVSAVNALFAGPGEAAFLFPGRIDFHPVDAAGRADRAPLVIDGQVPVPLQFDVAPPPDGKYWFAGAFRNAAARSAALRIAELLLQAREGRVLLNAGTKEERPLALRDIAVLVRSRHEGACVQRALRDLGVGSAIASQENVFQSTEAGALSLVLAAIVEPVDTAVRRALACPLWRFDAGELAALSGDEAFDTLRARLLQYRALWLERGFAPMFRAWLHGESIPARLALAGDPARALTNLLHLAELLQDAAREHGTPEALLRYLQASMEDPGTTREEHQVRLESDENLVQIATVHGSKGLQYPVVFLPFLSCSREPDDGPPTAWHRDDGTHCLSLLPDDDAQEAAARERLAEDIRLAYVALTRAQYLCVVGIGKVRFGENGALDWLLHAKADDAGDLPAWPSRAAAITDAARRTRIEALVAQMPEAFAADPMRTEGPSLPPAEVEEDSWQARTATRLLRPAWQQTSYTEIARLAEPVADAGAIARSVARPVPMAPPAMATPVPASDIAAFPRGRRAGNFFHALFERVEFTGGDDARRETLVRRQLQLHDLPASWAPVVLRTLADVLATPLPSGLRLADLPRGKRRHECAFHFRIDALEAAKLEALLGNGDPSPGTGRLQFAPLTGFMHGAIDLLFEHDGRYYLADWKSNHLGATADDYEAPRLEAAIREHRYDLQYSVYAVALHRHLASRLPGYDFDRDFGGIYYFFLRGMTPANGGRTGVFFRRPTRAEIEALDAAMNGGEAR